MLPITYLLYMLVRLSAKVALTFWSARTILYKSISPLAKSHYKLLICNMSRYLSCFLQNHLYNHVIHITKIYTLPVAQCTDVVLHSHPYAVAPDSFSSSVLSCIRWIAGGCFSGGTKGRGVRSPATGLKLSTISVTNINHLHVLVALWLCSCIPQWTYVSLTIYPYPSAIQHIKHTFAVSLAYGSVVPAQQVLHELQSNTARSLRIPSAHQPCYFNDGFLMATLAVALRTGGGALSRC